MIEVEALVKAFGPHTALRDVNLRVEAGETVVLVGPNGAGKTTLLRILATLIRPTSGSVRIAGLDPAQDGTEIRRQIGFLSHHTLLYEDLSAEQNLAFYARLYGIKDISTRIDALLARMDLSARRHDLVHTLSRGMQQRLAVARATLHHPQLLLLDEVFAGLDPLATEALTTLLSELAKEGSTLLLTTHNLEHPLTLGQRGIVLLKGKVVHDAPLTDIAAFSAYYGQLVAETGRKL